MSGPRNADQSGNRIGVGHFGPNKEAVAKPAARAAKDSNATTSIGGRGADSASVVVACAK